MKLNCKHPNFVRKGGIYDFYCSQCGVNSQYTDMWFLMTPLAIENAEIIHGITERERVIEF